MQTLIVVLLAVIAVSEILRLVLTHRPTTKRGHFKQKLEGVQKMVWDFEFKAYKTREIREDVRQEYDYMLSRIESYDAQIKNWSADKDVADKKRIEDQKVLAERDRDRLLAQIKQLDAEVEGAKPTAENHEGVDGISQQIESLRELLGMLKSWIKTL